MKSITYNLFNSIRNDQLDIYFLFDNSSPDKMKTEMTIKTPGDGTGWAMF